MHHLGKCEQDMLKAMDKCRKGTVDWHVCGLWVAAFKNERESYEVLANLLRTLFFLFERSEKQVDVLARKRFRSLANQLLSNITKREQETKRRWIKRNLGVRKDERRK